MSTPPKKMIKFEEPMRKQADRDLLGFEIDNNKELTLLDAIEQIVMVASDSDLRPDIFDRAARPIGYLCKRMNLTKEQAVLLSVFVNFSNRMLDITDLAGFFGCSQIAIIRYMKHVEELYKMRYLKNCQIDGEDQYKIVGGVIDALKDNKAYERPRRDGLLLVEFFEVLSSLISERKEDILSFMDFAAELEDLVNSNSHLPLVKKIKECDLKRYEILFLLWSCDMLVDGDGVISTMDVNNMFEGRKIVGRNILTEIRNGSSGLVRHGLLQECCMDGMVSSNNFELTPYVRKELLNGVVAETKQSQHKALTYCDSITAKELFYNPKEERSLSQLVSLLQPEKFASVCDRLEQKGMRRGFACLFYGGPGTGKTETVLQLARQTGRDLMQVDLANIRSKWVGESEKNIKAIFDTYRHFVKNCERTPILFFNEADAVISKRNEGVERAVDKMENSIQNIILQEIENLEGILIATTNLTSNMDSAFERRFLYKIEFKKPSAEAKRAIWQTMIPSLSAEDAAVLAARYDFSGGQIENVARKHAVEEVLWGVGISLDRLVEFCNEERLGDNHPQRRIGFIQ